MTDAEIIKALEFCEENKDNCFTCSVRDDCMRRDMPFIGWSLELIKSQKAEIERLNKAVDNYESCLERIEIVKAEAVKEFAERLKTHTRKMQSSDFSGEFWDKAVLVSDIDNLVKECKRNGGI